ncbi:MAG: aldo/keto reductase, partial [Rhodospirillales bacterium]|nr:aldo/keto reductase [Rhodospirillales bacterium]
EQLRDNLAAAELTLDAEELQTLDTVSALPAEYPGWMLALQGAYRATAPVAGSVP